MRDVAQYNSTTGTTSVIDHLIFDSFGQLSGQVSGGSYYAGPTTLPTTPRFGYAGMRLDFASGLSYDNARWYDPANGNWLSQDPLGFAAGDTNTSRYCGNSPTNATDPSGEDAADTGPTPSLRELADRLPHFNGVSDSDQALINAFEAGYGQCVSARLNYLTQKRKELFNGYDPGHTPTYPGYGDRWLQSLAIYDADLLECKRYYLAQQGIGTISGSGGRTPVAPTPPKLSGDMGTLLNMALAAGKSPSQAQFDEAERFVNRVKGGNSSAALGMVIQLREMEGVPYDNQLLAALDHYFNMRAVHEEFGIPAGPLLIANAALAAWKCLGLPFPTDSSKPYSPPSLLQWAAGNWGIADAVERNY